MTTPQTYRSLFQLAIAGVLIGLMLLNEASLPFGVIGLCVVLLMWLIIKTNVTPLLVTFQLILFFREPTQPVLEDELGSVVYVAVVLGLLMFLSRNQSLKDLIGRKMTELIKTLFGRTPKDSTTIIGDTCRPSALPTSPPITFLVRQVVFLLVCVLVSQLLLTTLGTAEGIVEEGTSATHAERLLKPVPPLLLITLVAVIVSSELAWRRLSVAQCSMYLRSTHVLLLYSDLRMILKRRLSFRRRQQSK